MTIVERVKALGLPLDEVVVIGSGLLDVLSLRRSHDIDLSVSKRLFDELKATNSFASSIKHGEEVLEKPGLEIWKTWGDKPDEQFEALLKNGIMIEGVPFCSPAMIIRQKSKRGTAKDLRDIALLQSYLERYPELIS